MVSPLVLLRPDQGAGVKAEVRQGQGQLAVDRPDGLCRGCGAAAGVHKLDLAPAVLIHVCRVCLTAKPRRMALNLGSLPAVPS